MLWLVAQSYAQESEEREGGIIGTGIVGVITHLGSLYVNDQHIRTDDTMPVDGAVPPKLAGELKPGHTVAIVAMRDDDGWYARHIRQVSPVVGPVTAMESGKLTVLGTQIHAPDLPHELDVGDWVAISGLWQGDRLVASRVDRLVGTDHQARLSGTYLASGPTGVLTIGGSRVTGINPQRLRVGDLVRVFWQPTDDGIDAVRLGTGLFDENVGVIQVQGYYSEPQPDGLYTVLGSGLVAYTGQPEMIDRETRVIRCGGMGQLRDENASVPSDFGEGDLSLTDLKC